MSKYLFRLSLWLFCLGWIIVACDDSSSEQKQYEYSTESGSINFVLKGYGHEMFTYGDNVLRPFDLEAPIYIENTSLSGRAYSYVKMQAQRLDEVTEVPTDGYESVAPIEENALYVARYSDLYKNVYLKLRIIRIEGSEVTLEYALLKENILPNSNANQVVDGDYSVMELEMPRRNVMNAYAPHMVKVGDDDVLNLAIEWNGSMKHAQWVAFSFNEVTGWDNNIGRADDDDLLGNDAWAEDELLPEEMRVKEDDHKSDGFDRGHLCASEDRQYSLDANIQTFYYSNMSPQIQSFNGGIWAKLEKQVQNWGYSVSTGTFNNVYVVKGGTLNNLLRNFTGTKKDDDQNYPTTDSEGKTIHGLACPAYYFMAIIAQKGNGYQAIAFLLPHDENLKESEDLKQFVVSIDELEELTGNDFFCNFPDSLEDVLESSVDVNVWNWN